MHQKFCVVDDELVLTGACNWTHTAFFSSNEDLLLIRDPALAQRYTVAFGALVRRYDPVGFRAADFGIARAEASAHLVMSMPRTRPGELVVITGGHPALGNWNPAQGIALRTSSSLFPSWGGRVRLPAGARVEWKAVVTGPQGQPLWELGGNRVLTTDPDGADGVTRVTFRDTVEVVVSVRAALPAGSELRLVGADPGLGSWDPTLGVPLAPVAGDPDRYTARLVFPGRASVVGKLVMVAPDGTVLWERGWNRWLQVHDQDRTQDWDLGSFRD